MCMYRSMETIYFSYGVQLDVFRFGRFTTRQHTLSSVPVADHMHSGKHATCAFTYLYETNADDYSCLCICICRPGTEEVHWI